VEKVYQFSSCNQRLMFHIITRPIEHCFSISVSKFNFIASFLVIIECGVGIDSECHS
jgi:hypothetical protein